MAICILVTQLQERELFIYCAKGMNINNIIPNHVPLLHDAS